MAMKVISLVAKMGEPRYCQSIQVNYWFWERGYDVIPFHRTELLDGSLDEHLIEDRENTIVYGAVAVVHDALKRMGIPRPANLDFPPSLADFFGRTISDATMGDVRELCRYSPERLPLHVKPRDRQKLFKGVLVESSTDLAAMSGVDDSEPVILQEAVSFLSEWRATILRDKVLNVAHYKGDPLIFPDTSVVRRAVQSFCDRPIGCAMDWGITDKGKTILVEVNDGFALGNYGVRGHEYTAMIECRWRELIGLGDNGVGWSE